MCVSVCYGVYPCSLGKGIIHRLLTCLSLYQSRGPAQVIPTITTTTRIVPQLKENFALTLSQIPYPHHYFHPHHDCLPCPTLTWWRRCSRGGSTLWRRDGGSAACPCSSSPSVWNSRCFSSSSAPAAAEAKEEEKKEKEEVEKEKEETILVSSCEKTSGIVVGGGGKPSPHWVCKECQKTFLSKATLQRHRLSRHAVQEAEEREKEDEDEELLYQEIRRTNDELRVFLDDLKNLKKELKHRVRDIQQQQKQQQPASDFSSGRASSLFSSSKSTSHLNNTGGGKEEAEKMNSEIRSSPIPQLTPHPSSSFPAAAVVPAATASTPLPRLGSGLHHWVGVGVVRGKVRCGHFWGHLQHYLQQQQPSPTTSSPSLSLSPTSSQSCTRCSSPHHPRATTLTPATPPHSSAAGATPAPTPPPSSSPLPPPHHCHPDLPLVLEGEVETHAYVERAPGQMVLYRQRIPIRCIVEQEEKTGSHLSFSTSSPSLGVKREPFKSGSSKEGKRRRQTGLFSVMQQLKEGDVVQVRGQYGLHASFDLVSKRWIENAVVEAEAVTVLQKGEQGGGGGESPLL